MKRLMNNFQSCRPAQKTLADKLLTPGHSLSSYSRSTLRAPRPDSVGVNSTTGFTLVEVMVAVAVVTMGIVAILGLIPVGLKSARDAADNTLAATLAQDAFGYMRREVLAATTWPPSTTPVTTYWDAAGETSSSTKSADSYFQVTLTWLSSTMPNSVLILTATVTWPAHATANQSSSVFVTEIARYNQ